MIDAATLAALQNSQIGTFVTLAEFELDAGTLRYTTNSSNVEYNGDTYTAFGSLLADSTSEKNIELDPAEFEVNLSGLTSEVLGLFLNANFLNRRAKVMFAIIDETQDFPQPIIGQPIVAFNGYMDGVEIEEGKSPIVSIKIRDKLSDWNRNLAETYNNADQLAKYPNDYTFEFLASYADKQIEWPADSVTSTGSGTGGSGGNSGGPSRRNAGR